MPTVIEILTKTTEFFAGRGLERPRLEAELLLARALKCRRLDLYLRFDQPLVEAQLAPLREMVARRGRREPLQYINGSAEFLDFTVACDRRALIPRPETEELVEKIFALITIEPVTALDLGTGTGVLALALARRWPGCRVTALDASAGALDLAQANAETLGLTGRIQFLLGSWLDGMVAGQGGFSLIVSNPPYLTGEELTSAAPEVRDWEPRAALVAGENGLTDLRAILVAASAHLAPDGLLALETGPAHHPALREIAQTMAGATGAPVYARVEGARDLSGRDRFFFAWRA